MSEPESFDRDAAPARSSSLMRTLVLLGLLVLIVGAGLWDHYGAKLPKDEAYTQIQYLQGASATDLSVKPAPTQAEVRKAVGREPSDEWEKNGLTFERYSWIRGVPFWTYDLYVVYGGDEKRMQVASEEEPAAEVYSSANKDMVERKLTPEEDAAQRTWAGYDDGEPSSEPAGETPKETDPAPGDTEPAGDGAESDEKPAAPADDAPETADEPADEPATEPSDADAPETPETSADETPTEEPAADAPASDTDDSPASETDD